MLTSNNFKKILKTLNNKTFLRKNLRAITPNKLFRRDS